MIGSTALTVLSAGGRLFRALGDLRDSAMHNEKIAVGSALASQPAARIRDDRVHFRPHQLVIAAVRECEADGEEATLPAVWARLEQSGGSREIPGGPAGLATLTDDGSWQGFEHVPLGESHRGFLRLEYALSLLSQVEDVVVDATSAPFPADQPALSEPPNGPQSSASTELSTREDDGQSR